MTAITMRFEGLYEKIMSAMKKSGLVASKSEAVRFSLFNTAMQLELIDRKDLLESLWAETRKNPLPLSEVMEGIENVKRKTIRR